MNGNARFIAVTSGCGGVGTSSLAVALGRVLSRLNEKKVLYVTFDFLASKGMISGGASRKDFLEYYINLIEDENETLINISDKTLVDEYGLEYLKCDAGINPMHTGIDKIAEFFINLNLDYDAVILDVPCNSTLGITVFPLCEDIVMNYGITSAFRKRYCDDYLGFISLICENSNMHSFVCGPDPVSFEDGTPDIHGEFGAEVRRLVEELGF